MKRQTYSSDEYILLDGEKVSKDNFVFNPKNPPMNGCTVYHPPLDLLCGQEKYQIYGSSCINPIIRDADIYVSLDKYTTTYEWEQPWSGIKKQHIRFFIDDGSVPNDIINFKKCIDYVIDKIQEKKVIHVGCISGHGRTGIFLAAIVQEMMGLELEKNNLSAIDYVRDNYCNHAVENLKQVLFLQSYFNVSTPKEESQKVFNFHKEYQKETGKDFFEIVNRIGFFDAWVYNPSLEISTNYEQKWKP